MIELISDIGTISVIVYLLLLLYIAIGIIRTKPGLTDVQPSVSVVISAHNESQNIGKCLDTILSQNYSPHKLEIIVVNDRSEDNTGLILEKYMNDYSQIQIITINEVKHGISPKKNAITQGVNIATGDIIATTDADCEPPEDWIKTLVSYFTPKTGMVVGLAPLKPTALILSPFTCIDAIFGSLIAYGSLGWNHAVTCTGRNFAYRKQIFQEINGFSGIDQILTGDDDLFMMQISRKTNWDIRFMSDPAAAVLSSAPLSLKHFITQRKRHISASKYFSIPVKIGFSLVYISKFLMFLALLLSLTMKINGIILLTLIFSAYLISFILLMIIGLKTSQYRMLILYPVWEIYYLIGNLLLAPLGLFSRISWGER